jgi:D-cysteine desulfhydrase family pyridoxal phosphate-dependent enzyme
LPTPIDHLKRMSEQLRVSEMFIKRDDLTGIAFGGNKTRKLEFLAAEAIANGAKTLVTSGSIQSNHCRQTAAIAAKFGLKCILVLSTLASGNDHNIQEDLTSGNLLLDKLFEAEVILVEKEIRGEILKQVFHNAWKEGRRPYLVPYGGSSPTGACAYSFALEEVLNQGYSPDCVVVATSSGGTQAGLVVGAELTGYRGTIVGISIDETASTMKEKIAQLATETIDLLGGRRLFNPNEILIFDDYLGKGYGICGVEEKEAILLFSRLEGILLDPVYTGRAAAGMIDLVRKEWFKSRNLKTILFWHTGGTPALFTGYYSRYLLS